MRIDSSGRVGIGTSSPNVDLHVYDSSATAIIKTEGGSGGAYHEWNASGAVGYVGDAGNLISGGSITDFAMRSQANLLFSTGGVTERMRIDSSGNVGIGTSSPNRPLEVLKSGGARLRLSETASRYVEIGGFAEGSANGSSMLFFTIEAGTSTLTERMRITSGGTVLIGTTDVNGGTGSASTDGISLGEYGGSVLASRNGNPVAVFNASGVDGRIIDFQGQGNLEGNISVSGSTVSYNGGHLARWSRLADDSKDTSIVKGTVLTNLDAMVVWSHDEVLWTADDELPDGVSVGDVRTAAYTEDNEQLNKMAVSSVEGDANVAGVFVNWDNDDDFNDMNIAMTGDMVIRIAQGTTVARGDLLISAGDGTAKPQGDDIVRSKTIAKVTSTHVSHTYDDGSYLVPCVLMAC